MSFPAVPMIAPCSRAAIALPKCRSNADLCCSPGHRVLRSVISGISLNSLSDSLKMSCYDPIAHERDEKLKHEIVREDCDLYLGSKVMRVEHMA